jgi:hypothetical protein
MLQSTEVLLWNSITIDFKLLYCRSRGYLVRYCIAKNTKYNFGVSDDPNSLDIL